MDEILAIYRQVYFYTSTSVLVPLVFGLVRFRKPASGIWPFAERRRLDRGMTLLFYYILVALVVEMSAFLLVYYEKHNDHLLSAFTLFEYLFLILIFGSWQKNSAFRKALYVSIPLFALLWLTLEFGISMEKAGTVILPLTSVIFIALSVQTLFLVNRDSLGTIFSRSEFWFASSVLLYFAGNLLVFSLPQRILQEQPAVWFIHTAMNLIHYLFYAKAFACQKRSTAYGS